MVIVLKMPPKQSLEFRQSFGSAGLNGHREHSATTDWCSIRHAMFRPACAANSSDAAFVCDCVCKTADRWFCSHSIPRPRLLYFIEENIEPHHLLHTSHIYYTCLVYIVILTHGSVLPLCEGRWWCIGVWACTSYNNSIRVNMKPHSAPSQMCSLARAMRSQVCVFGCVLLCASVACVSRSLQRVERCCKQLRPAHTSPPLPTPPPPLSGPLGVSHTLALTRRRRHQTRRDPRGHRRRRRLSSLWAQGACIMHTTA